MLGQNILNYAHPNDRPFVRQALIPDNLDTMFDTPLQHQQNHSGNNGTESPDVGETASMSDAHRAEIESQLQADRRRFTFRWVSVCVLMMMLPSGFYFAVSRCCCISSHYMYIIICIISHIYLRTCIDTERGG